MTTGRTGRLHHVDADDLASLRSRVGTSVSVRTEPYLTEVSRDAARHWADATGDRNPLWRDAGYARRWGFADTLAPPTILYAFSRLSIGYRGGLPGVHSFFAGTNWTWHRPIARGTEITAEAVFKDLVEHRSSFAEVSYQQISDVSYQDTAGRPVASAEAWGMRISRASARERRPSRPVQIASYTPEQIDRLTEEYAGEYVRLEPMDAAEPSVGARIPSILRGPYTVTTAVAFEQAWGGLFIKAHGEWYDYLRRHPAAGLANAQGVPEPPEAVHWDPFFARQAGLPEPYDYGPERLAWIAVLLTNWIGPTGFLRSLNVQIRRFNLIGDLTRCHGRVTGHQSSPDGTARIALDVWADNQRGERTATGTAEVQLPALDRMEPA